MVDSDLRPDVPPLVLIVEDDESNRELFQLVLERAGMRVMSARDLDEARALASAIPDAIVADVRMPLGDGMTLVRALHANPALEGVPILLVTAFLLSTDDLRRLEDHGPVDAVLKPFKTELLVKFVEALLARARSSGAGREAAPDRPSIPSASEVAARPRTESSPQLTGTSASLLRAKTVLLIEDDGAFRYAVGRMLREAGAHVVETGNLENALSALNERPEIEAIIADVVLPDGIAPEGLKIFEQQRRLPVLYVTGYSDQLLNVYGLSARDPHLLMKPFDAATLVSRLTALGA